MRALTLLLAGACLLSGCQACQRLEAPYAFRCERDAGAEQCLAGWRCGLDGFCFDPSVPRVAPCEADDDCAPSHRCATGLAGAASGLRCRARGLGAPFACAGDDDCEGGWRCGLAGVCLDTAPEALPEAQLPPGLAAQRWSSLLDTRDLVDVAVSDPFAVDVDCPPAEDVREVLAIASRAGVVQRVLRPGVFSPDASVDCDAGARLDRGARASATLERFTVDAGVVVALAQSADTTYVLGQGGRLCRIDARGAAGCEALGSDARSLRVAPGGLVFVFGASVFRVLDLHDGGWSPPLAVESVGGGVARLHEVSSFHFPMASSRVLVATTPEGFLQVPVEPDGRLADGGWPQSGDWRPAVAGLPACAAGGEEPLGLRYDSALDRLLVLERDRGSAQEGAVVFAPSAEGHWGCEPLGFPGADAGGYVVGTPLRGRCNPGARLLSADVGRLEIEGGAMTFELRCLEPDGGLWVRHADAMGPSTAGSPPALLAEPWLAPSALIARANPGRQVTVSASGGAWLDHGASHSPWLLDRQPLGMWALSDGGAPVLVAETREVAGSTLPGQAKRVGGFFSRVPDLGFVFESTTDAPLVALSATHPSWALFSAAFQPPRVQQAVVVRDEAGLRLVAGTTLLDQFSAPFLLAPSRSADGGTVVLLSAYDALLAADVTETLSRPSDPNRDTLDAQPVLTVRAVPLSRGPITSLLPLTPVPDAQGRARLAEGYLLSAGRVFRFEGDNEAVWRTRELEAPFGEPLALFSQAERARVGYRSGEVYSLPSRVQLAPALPRGARAEDYAVHCGAVVVVTAEGLAVLEVLGSEVLGRWRPVAVSRPPGAGATLVEAPGQLLVVSTDGSTEAFGWACP